MNHKFLHYDIESVSTYPSVTFFSSSMGGCERFFLSFPFFGRAGHCFTPLMETENKRKAKE